MKRYVKAIDLQESYQIPTDYEYALLYMISEIILCRTEKLPPIDWEECQEARFFSGDKELHIFEGDDGMQEVCVQDADEDIILIKEYELDNKFRNIGKTVLVQEYLAFDEEDGQVRVEKTRLRGIR